MKRISRKLPINRTITLFALIIILIIYAGCRKEEAPSPYKVIDSGIWTYPQGLDKTAWLDNDRILFISNKTLKPQSHNIAPPVLTVWNPNTGKVNFYHEVYGLTCVREGQVLFWEKDVSSGKSKIYRGPIENPKTHPAPGPDKNKGDGSIYGK